MDEHIRLTGAAVECKGELIDDNLNTLSWWTAKHNGYASREAVDLLNLEFNFLPRDSVASLRYGRQSEVKRWMKEEIYFRMPSGFRAFLYFAYRYFIRLGFLDGPQGFAFHFLQGFWYRYLVDAKVAEVKRHMQENGVDIVTAIRELLSINAVTACNKSVSHE